MAGPAGGTVVGGAVVVVAVVEVVVASVVTGNDCAGTDATLARSSPSSPPANAATPDGRVA